MCQACLVDRCTAIESRRNLKSLRIHVVIYLQFYVMVLVYALYAVTPEHKHGAVWWVYCVTSFHCLYVMHERVTCLCRSLVSVHESIYILTHPPNCLSEETKSTLKLWLCVRYKCYVYVSDNIFQLVFTQM